MISRRSPIRTAVIATTSGSLGAVLRSFNIDQRRPITRSVDDSMI
jgi:hypothetical protein